MGVRLAILFSFRICSGFPQKRMLYFFCFPWDRLLLGSVWFASRLGWMVSFRVVTLIILFFPFVCCVTKLGFK